MERERQTEGERERVGRRMWAHFNQVNWIRSIQQLAHLQILNFLQYFCLWLQTLPNISMFNIVSFPWFCFCWSPLKDPKILTDGFFHCGSIFYTFWYIRGARPIPCYHLFYQLSLSPLKKTNWDKLHCLTSGNLPKSQTFSNWLIVSCMQQEVHTHLLYLHTYPSAVQREQMVVNNYKLTSTEFQWTTSSWPELLWSGLRLQSQLWGEKERIKKWERMKGGRGWINKCECQSRNDYMQRGRETFSKQSCSESVFWSRR